MSHPQNINLNEEDNVKKIMDLVLKNYIFFTLSIIIALSVAFFINRYSIPIYSVSSSILIKGSTNQPGGQENAEGMLFGNMFGSNQNLQNELFIMKSYPVVEKTIRNLDLSVTYFTKGKFNYYEVYENAPFLISYLRTHPQPLEVRFDITFQDSGKFILTSKVKKAEFINFESNQTSHTKEDWIFLQNGKVGQLIETPDLAFIVEYRDTTNKNIDNNITYGFQFSKIPSISKGVYRNLEFTIVDKLATVIQISLKTESLIKGEDILNELMNVYSDQNLERKNHLASITIDYIEEQLNEISDSLTRTEDNLQRFRSSNQLLNITDQATGISSQYLSQQEQLAELVSRKRYFDYVIDLLKNNNYSNMMLPASIGISDQLLNTLMTDLITAEARRSNLIENNQERNPLVQKLGIEIENLKKVISENISAIGNTTSISIDEMNKRIRKTEAEINRLPATQRQLGSIERKFRLNDAIYNYLMEKHAEAKITQASNLPDNIIIEQAKGGSGPISPNRRRNYMLALCLGLVVPFGFVWARTTLNNKIESQDDIESLTDSPVLGKIMHNRHKTRNVMFEFPKSNIAESFRALRTNLDFYVRSGQKKIILITSCFENEGKSFIALNLAMSYAQLGRKTLLVDCDLRKPKIYFREQEESQEGLSSYMIDKAEIEEIILKSPHPKLDYIIAGILPPNPVELLALDKTEKLLARLRSVYDIIVLDTTPLAQVTDAYLLINHSDLNIITARHGQTIKNVFSLVMKDLFQKKINNTCIVLNDNRIYRDQYGYGYGYYNKKGFLNKRVIPMKKRIGRFIHN